MRLLFLQVAQKNKIVHHTANERMCKATKNKTGKSLISTCSRFLLFLNKICTQPTIPLSDVNSSFPHYTKRTLSVRYLSKRIAYRVIQSLDPSRVIIKLHYLCAIPVVQHSAYFLQFSLLPAYFQHSTHAAYIHTARYDSRRPVNTNPFLSLMFVQTQGTMCLFCVFDILRECDSVFL